MTKKRNPVAAALRNPALKPKVIPNKKKQTPKGKCIE